MTRVVSPVLALLALSGCGTFSDEMCKNRNPVGPAPEYDDYYRGVRYDYRAAKEDGDVLMLTDIPFSFVADTLRIPFIAYDDYDRGDNPPRKEDAARPPAAAGEVKTPSLPSK